jgi:hypothetical protein
MAYKGNPKGNETYQELVRGDRLRIARLLVVDAAKVWARTPSVKTAVALAFELGILAGEEGHR